MSTPPQAREALGVAYYIGIGGGWVLDVSGALFLAAGKSAG